jgi:hypothetical protein
MRASRRPPRRSVLSLAGATRRACQGGDVLIEGSQRGLVGVLERLEVLGKALLNAVIALDKHVYSGMAKKRVMFQVRLARV